VVRLLSGFREKERDGGEELQWWVRCRSRGSGLVRVSDLSVRMGPLSSCFRRRNFGDAGDPAFRHLVGFSSNRDFAWAGEVMDSER
jgi:hypothetical protein